MTAQLPLALNPEPVLEPRFGGATYIPSLDSERLSNLYGRVWRLMLDGCWRTLAEIKAAVGGSEGGIGARLRDFRKPNNGLHDVLRRRRGGVAGAKSGVWEYKLIPNPEAT